MVCIVHSKPRKEIGAFVTGARRALPRQPLGPQWLAEALYHETGTDGRGRSISHNGEPARGAGGVSP